MTQNDTTTHRFGLIGYPLGHSFSKAYFAAKFEREGIAGIEYANYPIETADELPDLIRTTENLRGLNVTIPHKQAVIPLLDELDTEAEAVGAVNTILIRGNGQTKGFNTDVYGFEQSLEPLLREHHQAALILGTGGAAKAVEYVMQKLGIATQYVSRTKRSGGLSYAEINRSVLADYRLVINTTPLGMSPHTDAAPDLPYEHFTDKHLAFDLIYNPAETEFMRRAKRSGATVKNGLEMLEKQAERAWSIWSDHHHL